MQKNPIYLGVSLYYGDTLVKLTTLLPLKTTILYTEIFFKCIKANKSNKDVNKGLGHWNNFFQSILLGFYSTLPW